MRYKQLTSQNMRITCFSIIILFFFLVIAGCKLTNNNDMDNSLAGRFLVLAKATYIYKPMVKINNGYSYIVCVERDTFFTDTENQIVAFLNQMDFGKKILKYDKNYIYLLIDKKNLIAFLRSTKGEWVSEINQEDKTILFTNYFEPMYIIDENGIELSFSNKNHDNKSVLVNNDNSFLNIYLCKINDYPIFYSLKSIKQICNIDFEIATSNWKNDGL